MINVEEWCKIELPSFEIDIVALGFQKESIEQTIREDEVEICPACGKPMKKERKVKTFVY
jgi:ssDNA-binding Zn-finger/Zn-ribbon topoisomerase 1